MDELYSIPGEPLELRRSDVDIQNLIYIIFVLNMMYLYCSMSRLRIRRNAIINAV
jgi:hypothetical protein